MPSCPASGRDGVQGYGAPRRLAFRFTRARPRPSLSRQGAGNAHSPRTRGPRGGEHAKSGVLHRGAARRDRAVLRRAGRYDRRHLAEPGDGRQARRALRRRSALLQPLSSGDSRGRAGEAGRLHRVRDPRRARQRPDARFGRGRRHRGRPQPGPSDDRAGAHRGRRGGRRAGGDPGRHRARPVRLHRDRAGLRLPARPLHRALPRQLEARPAGGDLGPDAGRPDSDRGVHGLGRRAAGRHRGQDLARARAAAGRGGRRRPAAAADRRSAGGGLRARRQPPGPVPAHHPAARERRQHGRPADADRHDAAAALLHRRLRPVRRRRPLRPGRRRGLGHRDRDGRRGHGADRGAEGPRQRRSPRRTSRAASSSRRSRPSGSTPRSASR